MRRRKSELLSLRPTAVPTETLRTEDGPGPSSSPAEDPHSQQLQLMPTSPDSKEERSPSPSETHKARPPSGSDQTLGDPEDGPPGPVRRTDTGTEVPQTSTGTRKKSDRQYIVDEDAILQLMKVCPLCNGMCRCSKHSGGPYFVVYQSCYYCHYRRRWSNQPEAGDVSTSKARRRGTKRKLKSQGKVSLNIKAKS